IERRDAQPAAANDGADTDTETVLAMGTPIAGVAFRILADGDHALANRVVGEVAIRGTSVMLGYLNPDDGSIAAPLTADG
ncbi:hypothetical protein J8J21_22615, partial [Mycobacterium tuberculosis]|nr:hypothetical protein [Mycobacterium tuberculosis]